MIIWTNISVTVQIPVRWEFRHLAGVFTGLVADFLEMKEDQKGKYVILYRCTNKTGSWWEAQTAMTGEKLSIYA